MKKGTNRSRRAYTFDTNVVIDACRDSEYRSLLSDRLNFKGSLIHLNSKTILEAEKKSCNVDQSTKLLECILGASVVIGQITPRMRKIAKELMGMCSTLHFPDNQILAYASVTGTTLVTGDKGMAQAARTASVNVVNPDLKIRKVLYGKNRR